MAKGTGARRHVHKYFRLIFDGLWHCGEKNCTHFMPGNMPSPLGKDSICWNCGRPFELTADHLDSRAPDHPTCEMCPAYDVPKLDEKGHEELSDFTEVIQKKIKTGAITEDETPVMHGDGCPAWLGDSCNCGVGDS